MTTDNVKIPDAVKITPRCPLCHAMFAREVNEVRRRRLDMVLHEAKVRYDDAVEAKDAQRITEARKWGEMVEASIRAGAAEVFACHFCRIAIGCNDPFVGRWEEVYNLGEKVQCPACEHEMRMFCTSTGYAQFKCPVKTCQAKWESKEPDRKTDAGKTLFDKAGNPIALPGVDRPISTPESLSAGQLGAAPMDPGLPDTVNVPLPPQKEGHA